jgi:uncharacterized repeat protein (TIGR01451 family)
MKVAGINTLSHLFYNPINRSIPNHQYFFRANMNFLPLILLCIYVIISPALAIGINASKRRFRKKLYHVYRVWSGCQGLLLAIGLPLSIHSGELFWINLLGLIVWSLSPARSATVELLNLAKQRGFRAWVLSGLFFLTVLTNLQFNLWFSPPAMAATESFAAGAYIIDMGQATQTVANGLKPYGLVYELAVNRGIPVKWAIEPTKAKGGSDFIAAGKTYKGSAFIVPAAFAADAATAITTWRTTGVIVDGPLAVGFSAPIYDTITSFPRIVLDLANGSIAQSYLTNAGIPAIGNGPYGTYNTYRFATPAQLTNCDDLYAMPHADPTWATHNNLIPFNASKGYIWAACHAVNVLENIDDPGDADTAPNMNFLSTNGLVPHKNHANAVPPYTYKPIADADPVMQFIGGLDGATDNGSEQVYLPNLTSGWRPTTRIAVIDPDHPQVPPASSALSPGEAVKVAYGRGFGVASNGMVMYEGGHDHTSSGTLAEQIAAQRAFLNFALLAGTERGLDVSSTIPTNMVNGAINNVSAIATGGSGIYTYKWYSSCGGTFANSNSASTTFTAPITGASCSLRVVVSDSCSRRSINAASVLFPARIISGTVFEDVNYGGGVGRSQTTASGVGRQNATVELYDSLGTYLRNVVTDVNGKYTFTNLPDNSTYQIRVVNNTVSSSRNVTAVGLLPVQTFRTDAGTTVSGLFDRVGGEKPNEVDPPANTGLQTLTDLNNLTNQEVQSLTLVNIVSTDLGGIDFGYNFDTIVNTNDAGQGSLRQFILNSNALSNTGLDQVPNPSPSVGTTAVDPAAGEEASIFMISDGLVHPGLRVGLSNLLTSGVAAIVPTTPLPVITDIGTSIDGRTQTANVGNTKTGSTGYSSTVGVPASTSLSGVPNPEVQISNNQTQSQGLNVTGNNFAARGISIYGFGNVGIDNNANILLNGSSNSVIEKSLIGTASGAVLDTIPTNGNGVRHGIAITNSATNITIQDNAIAENGVAGIFLDEAGSNAYSKITIQRNEAAFNGVADPSSGDGLTLFNCTSSCTVQNNYIHDNKAYGIQDYQNQSLNITANTINSNGSGGTETAGIIVWGSTGTQILQNIVALNTGDGVYLARHPYIATQPLAKQVKISQNSFFGNGQLGIDLAGPSANPTVGYRTGQTPYVTANDGITGNTISNNGIDYPVITYSTLIAGNLQVKGFVGNMLTSTTFSGAKLEFFIADNSPANQNGEVILNDGKSKSHGEGRTYLGNCVADGNSQFNCSFPTAGAVGLASATNITATATDGNGNTSEFSAVPSTKASFVVVKRITAITDGVTNTTTNLNSFVDDPNTTDDNHSSWPSGYLLGAIDGGKVKPGDEVEYTIYFLNGGENRITQARLCDRLNADLIFQPQFDISATNNQGILFAQGIGSQYLTNISDSDRGLLSTSSTMPLNCNITSNNTLNLSNNIVVVDVATSSNPLLSGERGYIKFKVKVRQ